MVKLSYPPLMGIPVGMLWPGTLATRWTGRSSGSILVQRGQLGAAGGYGNQGSRPHSGRSSIPKDFAAIAQVVTVQVKDLEEDTKAKTGASQMFKVATMSAQESRSIVKSKSNCAALPLTSAETMKDVEEDGLMKINVVGYETGKSQETARDLQEMMRRQRISAANKGKVAWNKGRKHSAETVQRIKERTFQAMSQPSVIEKLKRAHKHSQTKATRLKIGVKLRAKWQQKRLICAHANEVRRLWGFWVAEEARLGSLGEEALEWNSYSVIKEELRQEARNVARLERSKRKQVLSGTAKAEGMSNAHRQKISDAIRAKWEDPEYQAKVLKGIKNRVILEPRPRRTAPPRRPRISKSRSNPPKASGIVKSPDLHFVTSVMSNEKGSRRKEFESQDQTRFLQDLRFRNLKVDLLKKSRRPVEVSSQSTILDEASSQNVSTPGQIGSTAGENIVIADEKFEDKITISAAHSFTDPLALEKLNKLKMIQANRVMTDQKNRKAVERARMLISQAEQAVNALEAIAGCNEFAWSSLTETRRIIMEAVTLTQRAESATSAKRAQFATLIHREELVNIDGGSDNNIREEGRINSSAKASYPLQIAR